MAVDVAHNQANQPADFVCPFLNCSVGKNATRVASLNVQEDIFHDAQGYVDRNEQDAVGDLFQDATGGEWLGQRCLGSAFCVYLIQLRLN